MIDHDRRRMTITTIIVAEAPSLLKLYLTTVHSPPRPRSQFALVPLVRFPLRDARGPRSRWRLDMAVKHGRRGSLPYKTLCSHVSVRLHHGTMPTTLHGTFTDGGPGIRKHVNAGIFPELPTDETLDGGVRIASISNPPRLARSNVYESVSQSQRE